MSKDESKNEEKVETKPKKKKIVATPVYTNGYIEPPKGKDIGDMRKDVIEGRYIKKKLYKVIVTDQSGFGNESFTTITPMTVTLEGHDGEYLDLKCMRYIEVKGRCGEEVEINQYVYGGLRGSTRPVNKRVKQGTDGAYTDVAIKARNWAIEQVD